jgi:hypothetical protein
MAYALELAFDIPPAWGYLVCALVVIPLVTHGVTVISRLQVWTQPLWLVMLVLPYAWCFKNPGLLNRAAGLRRRAGRGGRLRPAGLWRALTVGIALITQMGEQADYLRFMPEKTAASRWRWWAGGAGGRAGLGDPGGAEDAGRRAAGLPGAGHMVPPERAVDPNQMYLAAWEYVFPHYGWAVAATACSWWCRSSRSTSPTPTPAAWPGATSSRG